jgi:hypothetical protein
MEISLKYIVNMYFDKIEVIARKPKLYTIIIFAIVGFSLGGPLGALIFTIFFVGSSSVFSDYMAKCRKKVRFLVGVLGMIFCILGSIASAIVWIYFLQTCDIYYAPVLGFVLTPMTVIFFVMPILYYLNMMNPASRHVFVEGNTYTEIYPASMSFYRTIVVVIFSVSMSLPLTLTALFAGHVIDSNLPVPQTAQMLIANAIFDGITVIVTLYLLRWAIMEKAAYRIPIAVFIDICASSLLAVTSLYLGLFGTKYNIGLDQTFNVLIGKSIDGLHVSFGPYFWAMHTVFLPIFIYIVIIWIAYVAKMFLIPIKIFFGKGQEHKNPLRLTAALFAFLATTFTFLALASEELLSQLSI